MKEQSSLTPQQQTKPASAPAAVAAEASPLKKSPEQEMDVTFLQRLPVQRKLSIGAVDDPLEHEADEMADNVMRIRDTAPPFVQRRKLSIQRQFDEREEGEGEDKELAEMHEDEADEAPEEAGTGEVQRKPLASFIQKKASAGPGISSDTLHSRLQVAKGGGSSMDDNTKSFMESRFGADFSNVRIHTGDDAVQMSRDLSAQAFTVGNDVYFNRGKYAPGSPAGKHLLAHELTHTMQQAGGIKPKKIQRSFFGDIWEGIKSAAGTVWNGIKTGAATVWSGIKTGAGAVWSGLRAFGGWAWNVIKSAGSWVWDMITWMPKRLWSLIKHLGTGIADIVLWIADIAKVIRGDEGLLHWLGRALKGGAAWVLRFLSKTLDIVGIGEFWTLLTNIIKFNSRVLTDTEREEAQKVYGNAISYWQVRIDEYSLISLIGAAAKSSPGMGVTTAHTINFNKRINATAGSGDMAWLIHEMGHVAQYTRAGMQYMGEAIYAQATAGYEYGGGAALAGKDLKDFNREQQPDILKDYYVDVLYAASPSPFAADYVRMKNQAQQGEF